MKKKLSTIVCEYAARRDISEKYVSQLHHAATCYSVFLGREATTKDLKTKRINQWLKSEQVAGRRGDRSRSNLRKSLICVWKASGKPVKVDSVRPVKVSPKNPVAWGYGEVKQIVAAMEMLPGFMPNGVPRSLMMASTIWFAYETGLRRRDIWEFDFLAFDDANTAAMTQHKVRRVHIVRITPTTAADLQTISDILRERGDEYWHMPLRWPQSERQFYYWMKRAREIAGVDPEIHNRALQHLRRTGATAVELAGGKPWQFLGHAKPGLDRISYVDGVRTYVPTLPSVNRESEVIK